MSKKLPLAVLLCMYGVGSQQAIAQVTQAQAQECFASLPSRAPLAPLADKVVLSGEPKATLEMQASTSKPDAEEKVALSRWQALRNVCHDLGKEWLESTTASRFIMPIVMQTKDSSDALVAQLYRGEMTYGEFNVKQMALSADLRRRLDDAVEVARREAVPTSRINEGPQVAPPVVAGRDLQRDRYECEQEAVRSYPVVIVQRMTDPGFQAQNSQRPIRTNCSRLGNQVVCQSDSTGAGASIFNRPPSYVDEDSNLQNRQFATRSCMLARGWRPK